MFDIDDALRHLIKVGGSDLHLKAGSPPIVRVNGELSPIEGAERLSPEDTAAVVDRILTAEDRRAEFDTEGEADFAYSIEGLARFRVNAFHQRGTVSVVARAIPFTVRSVEQLGLPPVLTKLAEEERGIVLLTGTTGSGKSTTLAAMIDHVNRTSARHIVTIEDPIEYLHRDRKSVINQREVGEDTMSFGRALRRVLRQDPDIILIGEMRDEETVRTALSAAETGHLVLSTLHTVDAPETVNRIIDFFPPHQQQQARAMLAGTLKGIVSQRLIQTANRQGRVAACEILVMTGRVRDMISDPEQTGRLSEVIMEGEYYGMQTFDQALLAHVQSGRVAMDDALRAASHPHDFKLLLASDGKRSTSMDDIGGGQPAEPSRRPIEPPAPAVSPARSAPPPTGPPTGPPPVVRA
ncbi:MAG: type IV pilus twitching motility protein PilT [Solirubrobacteraceae bacterium]